MPATQRSVSQSVLAESVTPRPIRTRTSFKRLQWWFPIAVTLHNFEEAIWAPGWAARHGIHLPFTPGVTKLRIALLVLTIAAFAVTYMSARKGSQSVWAYLTFGYIVAMLMNVFIPHLPATLWFRSYTPGVITAVAVNLPIMICLAARALRDNWVSGTKAFVSGVVVPMALAVSILLTFPSA